MALDMVWSPHPHVELLRQFQCLQESLNNEDITSAQSIALEILETIRGWESELESRRDALQSEETGLILERQQLEVVLSGGGQLISNLANYRFLLKGFHQGAQR